jgi:predicted nucleic-acid-binding protein
MPAKSEYLPDTNTVLRYLLNDHPDLSQRARVFWDAVRLGEQRAILAEGVLMECVYVLQRFYKVPRGKIALNLKGILSYKGLDATNKSLFDQTLTVYQTKNLDFVDCLLAVRHARGEGILFSFDDNLNKLVSAG